MKTRTRARASKSRIASAFRAVTKSRKRVIAAAVISACVIVLSLALSQKRSYSLSRAVTHSVYTIPKDAVWYLEVLEPQQLYSIFENSPFGKSVIESKAWEKLAGTPEFHTISNLLYFIELKAGVTISYKEIPSFLGGSAGMAKMRDGSMLIVAKTNLKSRFTVSLLAAFKGKKVALPEKSPAQDGKKKLEGVTADSYKELFGEESVPFENLTATKVNTSTGALYLVMLEDYLFVSDSADTLRQSLRLATQDDPSSVRKIEGMNEAVTAFEHGGHILLYLDGERSAAAPLLSAFVKGEDGAAIVLYPDRDKPLTGDIYAAGGFEPLPPQAGPDFRKIIPLDQAAAVYSGSAGVRDIVRSFKKLKGGWEDLYAGTESFLENAEIDADGYFGAEKGAALVFHSFEVFDKKPYPEFSFLYASKTSDTALARAIFKSGDPSEKSFQGAAYTCLAAEGKKYSPSFLPGKENLIASDRSICEKYISARKGNRPVLADDSSFAALGEYANAPHHLVMNMPKLIEAARSFFCYGAARNGGYTSVTVDRDIMPLTEPVSRYQTLHIASGLGNRKTGRIVLTEKKTK